jgi:hypothetical protein
VSVTEQEWLECTDPQRMVEAIRERITDRQAWLFTAACNRRTIPVLHLAYCPSVLEETVAWVQRRVHLIERFADGEATEEEARELSPPDILCSAWVRAETCSYNPAHTVSNAAVNVKRFFNRTRERRVAAREAFGEATYTRERAVQSHVLRCIVGNPSCPASLGLAWLTPDVTSLAEAAYEQRILPVGELDPARLAVLADALEDAGCTDAAILTHLRSPGPHVRGCWALDLILGKE